MFPLLFNITGFALLAFSTWMGLRLLALGAYIMNRYGSEIRLNRLGNWPASERRELEQRFPDDERLARFNRLKRIMPRVFVAGIFLLFFIVMMHGILINDKN